jgi:putative aldouronate transport system substrate-binding protein
LEKRDRLIDEWSEKIEFGTTRDPVQSVNEYIHLQKEAGLDIIVAEAQRQIDAYLANK